jgi:hypothetical protein
MEAEQWKVADRINFAMRTETGLPLGKALAANVVGNPKEE